MIGQLRGRIIHKYPPSLVLDVQGVGYEVEAPMTTFYDLADAAGEVTLYTHLVVRDDAHLLFGFSRPRQRELFRSLLKVNGIGPRVALAILSGLTTEEFMSCVAAEDVARLTHVPGIGRKTAQRLIVEMRDRVLADDTLAAVAGGAAPVAQDAVAEAVSALISLGYKPQEASRAVRSVDGEGLASEELIRRALRGIAGVGT
jgi:Holliday junction DNA helicase RuvA